MSALLLQGTSGIAYCPKSVDMNYAFYNLGIAKFNLVPPARIAVLGLVFVSVLEVYMHMTSIYHDGTHAHDWHVS